MSITGVGVVEPRTHVCGVSVSTGKVVPGSRPGGVLPTCRRACCVLDSSGVCPLRRGVLQRVERAGTYHWGNCACCGSGIHFVARTDECACSRAKFRAACTDWIRRRGHLAGECRLDGPAEFDVGIGFG